FSVYERNEGSDCACGPESSRTPVRGSLSGDAHDLRGLRRFVEGLDRARLAERVVAAEERLRLATDRVREVLELELVAVRVLELDELHLAAKTELEPRLPDQPGIPDDDRALGADRLELASIREIEPAVEVPKR